jgi:hypothetical protein
MEASNQSNQELGNYLTNTRRRLEAEGFEFDPNFKVGNFKVDLFAFKRFLSWGSGRRIACLSTHSDIATVDLVRTFSPDSFAATLRYKSLWNYSFVAFPVVVSWNFSEQPIEYVRHFTGKHYSVANLRWNIEHLVLADLEKKKIFHCESSPVSGGIEMGRARALAEKLFSF